MPTVQTEESYRSKRGVNTQRCWNFNLSKPEEAEIRLFAPTIDNMTGKEMAVLIMIHYRRYLHDDLAVSLIWPWSVPVVAG